MTKKSGDAVAIISSLREPLRIFANQVKTSLLTSRTRNALGDEIKDVIEELRKVLNELDPIRQPTSIFDPSNPKIVGRFASLALVAQPRYSLGEIPSFYGSGVYAIYYNGEFELYAPVSRSETPIYVGQAAPAVNNAKSPIEQGDRLCRRLNEHRKNIIKASSTLSIEDFEFRSLVVQSNWETATEDYLIHLFRPIWNNETGLIFGLGKHGDSATTRANSRSPWDTLHPGRAWAADPRLQDAKPLQQLRQELRAHFSTHPVFKTLEAVLAGFFEELRQI